MATDYLNLARDLAYETVKASQQRQAEGMPLSRLRLAQAPSTLYIVRRWDGWYWVESTNTWTADRAKATRFAPKGEAHLAMNERSTLRYGAGWDVEPIANGEIG